MSNPAIRPGLMTKQREHVPLLSRISVPEKHQRQLPFKRFAAPCSKDVPTYLQQMKSKFIQHVTPISTCSKKSVKVIGRMKTRDHM
jgi:hypothetical protein